ncbi:MAG TPA: threonine synthase [Thermomicrobiales bacterium]|nr:threonine synthase [Thermomicrobiales bacterium]
MSLIQDSSRAEPDNAFSNLTVRCMDCGHTFAATRPLTACPDCGGLLDAVINTSWPIDRDTFGTALPPNLAQSGVWRYRALLPAIPDQYIVTRAEGRTPIYWDDRIAQYAGVASMGLKHEGHNPTASFKDRGMTVGMSHAKAVGARFVACASTGNTSASLASYAASANIPALVLIPEGKISGGKLAQTLAHGALVVQIEGDFDAALALLRQVAADYDRYQVYLVNSVNPFRPEGQKTTVFELLEQLNWEVPDVIALPGGNLGNTAAFGKALTELYETRLIGRMPRIATIQAAGAAPFAAYYESGWDHFAPVQAETIATAIKIGNPASTARAMRAIISTGGVVTSVTDDEIMDAKAEIDRVGIGCEPASAASLAGVRKLVASGEIKPGETVVGILTGHVLKDTDAVTAYHLGPDSEYRPMANRPVSIPATLDALEKVLSRHAL